MKHKSNRSFAVLGLNTFGQKIADILSEKGARMLVIDKNEDLLYRYKDFAEVTAVAVNAVDEEALKKLGIEDIDVAVVAFGTGVAESILITTTLKTLGVGEIIARAHSVEQVRALKRVGATRVVFPEVDNAENVAYSILAPGVKEFITIANKFDIVQIDAPRGFMGKTLRELDLINRFGINVIAIKHYTEDNERAAREEGVAELARAEYTIKNNDSLVIAGTEKNVDRFKDEVVKSA